MVESSKEYFIHFNARSLFSKVDELEAFCTYLPQTLFLLLCVKLGPEVIAYFQTLILSAHFNPTPSSAEIDPVIPGEGSCSTSTHHLPRHSVTDMTYSQAAVRICGLR